DISYKITKIKTEPTDWENKWKEFYHPIRVGRNIIICPKWKNYNLNENEIKVVLDPGMAFGTGMHETTKMCIELLEDLVTHDCKILDIGCGSGILSITSLMLGSKSTIGVDIDPLAVKVSNENAKLNNLNNNAYEFIYGNLTEKISGKFDIICANIVADVIIKMLNNIKYFMHKNSFLICSGIIKSKKGDVIDKLESKNLIVKTIKEKNDWIALCCKIN
ncbi:MAG: 50S ribosomal protein L11 methyltransferase, partial [Oscillospiraceae bacterium]|nr:50S ribosomal protein L11 methyltransferase [Oscillospiraceae bacterium]